MLIKKHLSKRKMVGKCLNGIRIKKYKMMKWIKSNYQNPCWNNWKQRI